MPPATPEQLEILENQRPRLLERALEEASLWLGSGMIRSKYPETRWLAAFPDQARITPTLMSEHKRTWSIRIVAGNPYAGIAAAVRRHVRHDPEVHGGPADLDWAKRQILALGSALGSLSVEAMAPLPNGGVRARNYVSWASKVMLHAWPELRIFIWDKNVRTALNTKNGRAMNAAVRRGYAYENLVNECEDDLATLRGGADFQEKLRELKRRRGLVLSCVPRVCSMSDQDRNAVVHDFLERRLHDKYLWLQANYIDAMHADRE